MKLNLGCGKYTVLGWVNLDKETGWCFENGFQYPDESVEAISISHALLMVDLGHWPGVLRECYRVLKHGGVIRITDDDCESTRSKRYASPWPTAKVKTGPGMCAANLLAAGFDDVRVVERNKTRFHDRTIIQAYRNESPPYYFFVEASK